MPYIDVDIDADEYVSNCRKRDIKELIEALVDGGHLPNSVLKINEEDRRTLGEIEFSEKLEILKTKYYSLTQEEEEFLNKLFSKYI